MFRPKLFSINFLKNLHVTGRHKYFVSIAQQNVVFVLNLNPVAGQGTNSQ